MEVTFKIDRLKKERRGYSIGKVIKPWKKKQNAI